MRKFLVIGNPIEHSLSPTLHNYWIKKNGIEAIYEKQKLNESELEELIALMKKAKIHGANVTVPFKKTIIPFLDELSFEAEQTQSVNTLCFKEGKIVGHNTDIVGFETSIEKSKYNVFNKEVLILGAGGVVPSIIFALNKMKVSKIKVSNRTKEKAESLKKNFKNIELIEWGEVPSFDIIINATSLGLKNGQDFDFDFSKCKNDATYIDTIYNPLKTKTFRFLENKGIKVFNGLDMFIYQGHKSFYLWNKINPEIDDGLMDLLLSKLK